MKRLPGILLIAALALSVASCDFLDKLLSVNIFDSPLKLSASDASGMSVSELSDLADSPDFFDAVSSDPALETAVLDQVDDEIAAAGSPGSVQAAAILGTEVLIYSTPAGDIINNLVGQLESISSNPPDTPAGIESLFQSIVPASVLGNQAVFSEMINNLLLADAYFQDLGGSLVGGVYSDPDANAGEIAQNALVAALVASITVPGGWTPADPAHATFGDYLYEYVNGVTADAPTVTLPDTGSGYLANILSAASFDFSF